MKTSNGRMAPVVLTLFVMIVALMLAASNGAFSSVKPASWLTVSLVVLFGLMYQVIPTLSAAAVIYAFKGNRALLWGLLACASVSLLAIVLSGFFPPPRIRVDRSLFDHLIACAQKVTDPWCVISAAALFSVHFRNKWDRLRIATIILIGICIGFLIVMEWTYSTWLLVVQMVVLLVCLCALGTSIWCSIFRRQDVPHQPPVDSASMIALTCPRCGAAQSIVAGHGECGNCRLKISISLEEGACGHCRYPLRGLTGEKCPECGTKFASPDGPQPEAAAAASESVVSDSSTIAP